MLPKDLHICYGCMNEKEGDGPCKYCGFTEEDAQHLPWEYGQLPFGHVLAGRYLIGRILKSNGEGFLYLAYDMQQRRKVVVSEYMPRKIAERDEATWEVLPKTGREVLFKNLLVDFRELALVVEELAGSRYHSVIPVVDTFSEHGTAYAVYLVGRCVPFERYLEERGKTLGESEVKEMFLPLLHTVGSLHKLGFIHRGISPYTLYVDGEGRLLLFDFAIAPVRTAKSELASELFEGFSASEQYQANSWQGSWTDVYGAAAVMYEALTGIRPQSAMTRREIDLLKPVNLICPDVSSALSLAIQKAMVLMPSKRVQTMDSLISLMMDEGSGTAVFDFSKYAAAPAQPPKPQEETVSLDRTTILPDAFSPQVRRAPEDSGKNRKYLMIAMAVTIVILLATLTVFFTLTYDYLFGTGESTSSQASQEDSSSEEEDHTVPNFVGQYIAAIQSNPEYSERFQFEIQEEFSDDVAPGVVIDQSSPAGTVMQNRGTIILTVSKGSNMMIMPNYTGRNVDEVAEELAALKVEFRIVELEDDTAEEGEVLRTVPSAGSDVYIDRDIVSLLVAIPAQDSEESGGEEGEEAPSEEETQ